MKNTFGYCVFDSACNKAATGFGCFIRRALYLGIAEYGAQEWAFGGSHLVHTIASYVQIFVIIAFGIELVKVIRAINHSWDDEVEE